MQQVTPKWERGGVVLVCERCFKTRIPEETPDVAAEIGDFNLRDWLKARLKTDGLWGEIRAVSTSCMDVCALGRVTVSIQPASGDRVTLVLDPISEREELYRAIVRRFVTARK